MSRKGKSPRRPTEQTAAHETDGPPPHRPKPGRLTSDDKEIWQRVARTVTDRVDERANLLGHAGLTAMQRMLGELPKDAPSALPKSSPTTPSSGAGHQPHGAPPAAGTAGIGSRGEKRASRPPASLKGQSKSAPPLGLDNRELRRVRSGRRAIEARLDLHGMRQHTAHGELRAFLFRCQAKGARWVLVITGKGSRRTTQGPMAPRTGDWGEPDHALGASWDSPQPGVLRERVPRWLSEPELRQIVIGFTTASPQHGGEGALYVQLRRPPGAAPRREQK